MPLFTTKEFENTNRATEDTPFIISSVDEFAILNPKPKRVFWDDKLRGVSFTFDIENPTKHDGVVWLNGYSRDGYAVMTKINVCWAGAVTNDETFDSYAAIQKTIDYCKPINTTEYE